MTLLALSAWGILDSEAMEMAITRVDEEQLLWS